MTVMVDANDGLGQLATREEDKNDIERAAEDDLRHIFGQDDDSDLESVPPGAVDSSPSRKMMERTPEPAARRTALRRFIEVELEPDMRIHLQQLTRLSRKSKLIRYLLKMNYKDFASKFLILIRNLYLLPKTLSSIRKF